MLYFINCNIFIILFVIIYFMNVFFFRIWNNHISRETMDKVIGFQSEGPPKQLWNWHVEKNSKINLMVKIAVFLFKTFCNKVKMHVVIVIHYFEQQLTLYNDILDMFSVLGCWGYVHSFEMILTCTEEVFVRYFD